MNNPLFGGPALFEEEVELDERLLRKAVRNEGALELIELGNAKTPMREARAAQTPADGRMVYLAGVGLVEPRLAGAFDTLIGYLGGVVGDGISKVSGVLADIIKVPTDLVSQGVSLVLLNFASIVSNVPVIGDFVATILTAAHALAKYVLELPVKLLQQLSTLGQAFKTLTPAQQTLAFTNAMSLINKSAPPEVQSDVQQVTQTAPTSYGVEVGESAESQLIGVGAVALPLLIGLIAA